jgi:hypothetical protein
MSNDKTEATFGGSDNETPPPATVKPTKKPSTKIVAGGTTGAAVILVVWLASLFGLEIPDFVAAAGVTVLSFIAGYFVPDPRRTS